MCDWMDRVIARVRGGPDIDEIGQDTREALVSVTTQARRYRENTRRLARAEKVLGDRVHEFSVRMQVTESNGTHEPT